MNSLETLLSVTTASERDTERFAHHFAMALSSGDQVFLKGDLGAGKTLFARSVIRTIAGDEFLEVPSPTYTLDQRYDTDPPVRHLDLYRLADPSETDELDLDEVDGIQLIEWPEILGTVSHEGLIEVCFEIKDGDEREITLHAFGEISKRIERSFVIQEFLIDSGLPNSNRSKMFGDASTRSYEIVADVDGPKVLMNAPKQPDGPPIRNGKSYSEIAHLAEEVSAFAAVSQLLTRNGFVAPKVLASDLDQGLLLLDHLGTVGVINENRHPIEERYLASCGVLAEIHNIDWPTSIELTDHHSHIIHRYDRSVIGVETELLTDWFIPDIKGEPCSSEEITEFRQIWSDLCDKLEGAPHSLVLRDYHSPNIIWQADQTGTNRVGLIDFQDALIGPESYDVASLAQDARVETSRELEQNLINHYLDLRKSADTQYDEDLFRKSYAIMAAQRATKILGIFVRLHKRDNKPGYRKHIPRIREYLERNFEHPVLADYRKWFSRIVKQ